MKSTIILSAILFATTTYNTTRAQEVKPIEAQTKTPKLVVGLKTGIGLTTKSGNKGGYLFDNYGLGGSQTPNLSTGIFARYYMGQHFAIETGLNVQFYRRQSPLGYQYNVFEGNSVTTYYPTTRIRYNNFELPIEFQYHLGKKDAKLRPYFGIGFGYTRDRYVKNFEYTRFDGSVVNDRFVETYNDLFISFTQGLTYQVSERLQLNQSLRFKFGTISTTQLNFGMGYTISK